MKKICAAAVMTGLLGLTQSALATSSYVPGVDDTQSADGPSMQRNSIGLSAAYQQNIYAGVDNQVMPFPLINVTYGNFFFKGITAGYNTYKDDSVQFALIARPDFQGYNEDDSKELNGMGDRGYSFNVGGQLTVRTLPLITTVAALHDISGNTAGNTLLLKLATGLPLMDRRLVLSPSVTFTYQDSNIVDYYYGVKDSEATDTRSAYSPSNTVDTTLGLSANYLLTENWQLNTTYMFTKYGSEISDSPIVARSTSSTVMVGASYLFG